MKLFKKKYESFSDEELMNFLSKGYKSAFDEIYLRYASLMKAYFFRLLWKDKEKAEDFVHDLFAKIITKPTSFDTSRSFKTWIYSVANNMVKNEYKKQSVRGPIHSDFTPEIHVLNEEDVNEATHYQEFGRELSIAMSNLDQKHRIVFEMRHHDGLSIKEIAEIIDEKEGTIKSRLFYATKQLAENLKEYAPNLNR